MEFEQAGYRAYLKVPYDVNFAQTLKAKRPDSCRIDFKIRVHFGLTTASSEVSIKIGF